MAAPLLILRQLAFQLEKVIGFPGLFRAPIPQPNALSPEILYSLKKKPIFTRCRNFSLTRTACVDNEAEDQDSKDIKAKEIKVVDVDTSISYLNSKAFTEGYGDKPVWFHYRRNFKGQIPPQTRKNCKVKGVIDTASPCPICRDEYLVLHHRNTKLLKQFISPYSGEIFDTRKTGLCQHQHKNLTIEIMKAWDEGSIEVTLPFRAYDYDDYKN